MGTAVLGFVTDEVCEEVSGEFNGKRTDAEVEAVGRE